MTREDVTAVLALWARLNDAGGASDERFVVRPDASADLRHIINDQWLGRFRPFPACYVCDHEGVVVGWVQGDICPPHPILDEPPKVRIGNLWVEPPYRRRGVGRTLVETFVQEAQQAGFPWVEVGTLGRDARAVAFWRALGFGDWRVTLLRES